MLARDALHRSYNSVVNAQKTIADHAAQADQYPFIGELTAMVQSVADAINTSRPIIDQAIKHTRAGSLTQADRRALARADRLCTAANRISERLYDDYSARSRANQPNFLAAPDVSTSQNRVHLAAVAVRKAT
jgi:hypothetical protein